MVDAATVTLVAATGYKMRFTGAKSYLPHAELIHHGNVAETVFYQIKGIESELSAFAVAAAECGVLLPSERLTVRTPWKTGFWVRLISAGAPQVTVDATEK